MQWLSPETTRVGEGERARGRKRRRGMGERKGERKECEREIKNLACINTILLTVSSFNCASTASLFTPGGAASVSFPVESAIQDNSWASAS